MTEALKNTITDYKNKGERVDEVLYQEVMKVVKELEKEVKGLHWRNEWLKSQDENERLREAIAKSLHEHRWNNEESAQILEKALIGGE